MWWEVEVPPSFLCHLLERPPSGLDTFVEKQLTTDSLLLLIKWESPTLFPSCESFLQIPVCFRPQPEKCESCVKGNPICTLVNEPPPCSRTSGLRRQGPICPEKGQE